MDFDSGAWCCRLSWERNTRPLSKELKVSLMFLRLLYSIGMRKFLFCSHGEYVLFFLPNL